jgi:23S rRNA (adenine2503-C2)-methyltransferase
MKNIKAYSLGELEREAARLGLERYRAQQIYTWLWKRNAADFGVMTNLAKGLRERLAGDYYIGRLKVLNKASSADGTTKLLLGLEDGESIEAVYIPEGPRHTVCVSTQVGCPLKCTFCASGRIPFKRNLKSWEIADQVLLVKEASGIEVSNVVFMGIGEPLLNLAEVTRAFELLNSDHALNIGARHITVSTAGIVEGIERLAGSSWRVKLAISLNATTDALRNQIMPVNRKYPLKRLLDAIRFYVRTREVRATFEYILIHGVNDAAADARRLVRLLAGIPSKLNLIPFNEIPGVALRRPTDAQVLDFYEQLKDQPIPVMLRKSRGAEIMAGCGQLKAAYG